MCLDMLHPPVLHTKYTLRNHERNLQMSHSLWKIQLRGGQLINWNRFSWIGGVESTVVGSSCSAKGAKGVGGGEVQSTLKQMLILHFLKSWLESSYSKDNVVKLRICVHHLFI